MVPHTDRGDKVTPLTWRGSPPPHLENPFLDVDTWRRYDTVRKFEWDDAKNRENVQRHGIDFADATEVFSHPMLTRLDDRRDYGEDRWIGIGLMKNTVAVVVYVEWIEEERVRFISARGALHHERKRYNEEVGD